LGNFKNGLISAKFVERREADTKEQDSSNRPDGPRDPAVLVDINTDKKGSDLFYV
jgi:hypothetical protein